MAALQFDPSAGSGDDGDALRSPRPSSRISIVLGSLVVIATLRLGRSLVLPVVVALLLTLTLSAPVRWLERKRVPGRLAAAVVVFGALAGGICATTLLASSLVAAFLFAATACVLFAFAAVLLALGGVLTLASIEG